MRNCKRCDAPHKNKVFCSRDCHQSWDTEHKAFYEKNCELCGKYFSGGSILKDVRFCSDACARTYVAKIKRKNGSYVNSVRLCPICNEQIPNVRSKRANKRCSPACDKAYKSQLVIDAWISDPNTGTYKNGGLSHAVRRHLIREANGKCSRCGRSDVHPMTGNYVIEVDHVDGDRYNNAPENLEVLCGNCHSLTPTYKGGNARSVNVIVSPQLTPSAEDILLSKTMVKLWVDDDTVYNGKDTLPHAVRNYLIAKADYKCSKCDWSEVNQYTGRIPLEVDHIDGDAHNNIEANLQVLCPQCHACTPSHRALNKKSSRTGRVKKLVSK